MNRVQLKTIAKQQLQGNIGMLFVCLLITGVLSNSVPGLASLIVAPPLTLGLSMIFLGLTRNESPEINTLFSGFSYIGPAILLNIMIAVFTCLWSLLFVIPGIIKGISYSMAYFVLADNPELSAKEALEIYLFCIFHLFLGSFLELSPADWHSFTWFLTCRLLWQTIT